MRIRRSALIGWSLIIAAAISSQAYGAAGWTVATQITELNQQPLSGVGATLVFIETGLTSNPSGCSHQNGFYLAVSDERQKRIFAMLLSAQMSGRSVKIYTNGVCHHPWGYAELDGLVVN